MVASVSEEAGAGDGRPPGLDQLSADQLRTLAYASAIGREFDFRLLVTAMDQDEERLAEQLERLTHLGILRERVGGDRFGFTQDETRARIYQSLTASRLRVLHRKIAEAMERLYPHPPPEILPELGRHFFLGKVPEKSYEYNRESAHLARQDDSPEAAAHHLERARIDLRGLPGNQTAAEATLDAELGDLYYSMGDARSADRIYQEGLQLAGPDDSRLRARLLLARAEVARGDLNAAAAVVGARQARELFSQTGDIGGIASVHRILGRVALQRGAYREALDEGMAALDLLQQSEDPRLLGRLCIDIGDAFSHLDPEVRDEAVLWFQRAIDRLTAVSDWVEVARAYLHVGELIGETQPTDGLERLARAREYAERGHEPRWAAWALLTGVGLRLALGEVDEAERDNEQARRLLGRGDDPLARLRAEINNGQIAERRGQWEEAEASYERAREQAKTLDLAAEGAESHYLLARLWFKTRDLARAREAFEAAAHARLPTLIPSLAADFAHLGRQIGTAAEPGALDGLGSAPTRPGAAR
jgi:tetratricopeptide (TPR) repeat protein